MRYRNLGHSGLKVSVVSLGSWLSFEPIGQERVNALVRMALDGGVNLFDAADVYARGVAEEMLAKALEGQRRDHVVLATKCYFPMSEVVTDRGLSRKHIVESCNASLRRLRTDYLDLYQCHRYDPETPLEETVRSMSELIARGKILYWGTSMWSAAQLRDACRLADQMNLPRPISEQPRYNLLHRELETEVLAACEALGIGCIVWSPLAQGMLTGKYRPGQQPPRDSRGADPDGIGQFLQDDLRDDALWMRLERAAHSARAAGMPLARFALAWCLRHETVASVIVGATRPEQLQENLKAAEVAWTSGLERLAQEVGNAV
ncbi:MAG: aldo/keto reductase [Planctomycetota bacterium]|nr:MAG: aldo/keto reductase [Planctomycetota bacterium]